MTPPSGLYLVITDPVAGYAACTEAAVEAGLRYVQLRMKTAPLSEVTSIAREMRVITQGTRTQFVVNDNLEVALEVDADGLHLGQTDMNVQDARRRWPASTGKILGFSTHDASQAAAAQSLALDYIGVGPIYATPTKRIADPVLGVEGAAAIIRTSQLPTVAIGGIDRTRLREVLAAGIRSYAVVRYVCQRERPLEAIRELLETEGECISRAGATD